MRESTFVMLLVLAVSSAPCLISGYLIVFKNKRGLITGWDDARYTKPQVAANVIGCSLIILALCLAVLALLIGIELVSETFIQYFMVVILIPIAAAIYARQKYGLK